VRGNAGNLRTSMAAVILLIACSLPALAQDRGGAAAVNSPSGRGLLFSAFLFDRTLLGERWAVLRSEAEALFPRLKLKAVADLHVTVVYIGKDWDAGKLALLRQAVSIPLRDAIPLVPEIAYFGRNNRVVAVELKGLPEELCARIIGLKQELSQAGLKNPEAYDGSFRPHVTIAEARNSPPTEQEVRDLEGFREWVVPRLDLPTMKLALDPAMPVQWLLAAAPRPAPVPDYITVESFLAKDEEKGKTE